MEIVRRHDVGFYSDDAGLLDDLTQFIGAALGAWNSAVVVATEPHRESLRPAITPAMKCFPTMTVRTTSGGKAKTKNGVGVAQGPNKTCAKGKYQQGCTK
jgi:hypothetical protein